MTLIHFGGCLLPSSGSRGLKLGKHSSRWPFPGPMGEKDGRDGERDVCSRHGVITSNSNLAFYTGFLILLLCLQNKQSPQSLRCRGSKNQSSLFWANEILNSLGPLSEKCSPHQWGEGVLSSLPDDTPLLWIDRTIKIRFTTLCVSAYYQQFLVHFPFSTMWGSLFLSGL